MLTPKIFKDFLDSFNFIREEITFPKQDDPNFKYETFSSEKDGIVKKVETWISTDGTSTYSRVEHTNSLQKNKEELQRQLKQAVEKEDYELAAKLKKEIIALG